MTRNRILALLATLLLLIVVGILASCTAFDAVTGGVTRPQDPAAPVIQQPVPPAVADAQQALATAEATLADIGTAIQQAQTQAADDPQVAAQVGKLKSLQTVAQAQVALYRAALDSAVLAWRGTAGKPAGQVIVETGKPVVDLLPFPVNVYGSLGLAALGALGTLIQTIRQKKATATAENVVWSIEKARDNPEFDAALLKVMPVLNERQTDATKALVQRVTD